MVLGPLQAIGALEFPWAEAVDRDWGLALSMLGCSLQSGSNRGPLSATFSEKPAYPQSSCLLLSYSSLCST